MKHHLKKRLLVRLKKAVEGEFSYTSDFSAIKVSDSFNDAKFSVGQKVFYSTVFRGSKIRGKGKIVAIEGSEYAVKDLDEGFGFSAPEKDLSLTKMDSGILDSLTKYKGYSIEQNFYGKGEYTVQYQGDDVVFKSVEEAKEFINEISDSLNDEKYPKGVHNRSTLYGQYHNGTIWYDGDGFYAINGSADGKWFPTIEEAYKFVGYVKYSNVTDKKTGKARLVCNRFFGSDE